MIWWECFYVFFSSSLLECLFLQYSKMGWVPPYPHDSVVLSSEEYKRLVNIQESYVRQQAAHTFEVHVKLTGMHAHSNAKTYVIGHVSPEGFVFPDHWDETLRGKMQQTFGTDVIFTREDAGRLLVQMDEWNRKIQESTQAFELEKNEIEGMKADLNVRKGEIDKRKREVDEWLIRSKQEVEQYLEEKQSILEREYTRYKYMLNKIPKFVQSFFV